MKDLQALLHVCDQVATEPELLCLVRQTLIACAEQLRTDVMGTKTIRRAFYHSNKALAAWESERAFGVSKIFKTQTEIEEGE